MSDVVQPTRSVSQVLAICQANWEYRGIDPAAVDDMLEEVRVHLEEAEARGRTPADVVGGDPAAFAAAWAREREPASRRYARLAADLASVLGLVLAAFHLFQWSTAVTVAADRLSFMVATFAAGAVLELRRGTGFTNSMLLAPVLAIPVGLLAHQVFGDAVLFTVPIWVTAPLAVLAAVRIWRAQRRRKARAHATTDTST